MGEEGEREEGEREERVGEEGEREEGVGEEGEREEGEREEGEREEEEGTEWRVVVGVHRNANQNATQDIILIQTLEVHTSQLSVNYSTDT